MSYKDIRRLPSSPKISTRSQYDSRATYDRRLNGEIELAVPDRRPHAPVIYYDDDRRSYIDRGRGSQKSRGSRGSYGSSPNYSSKPLEAKIKHCCRVTIAFIFSNVGVCVLFVGYTILGSFIFQVSEFSYVLNSSVWFAIVNSLLNQVISFIFQIALYFFI